MREPHIKRLSLLTYASLATSKVIYLGASETDHVSMPALVLAADLPKLLVFAIQDIRAQHELERSSKSTAIAIETLQKKVYSLIGSGYLPAYDPDIFFRIDVSEIATNRDGYLVRLDDVSAWLTTQGIEIGYAIGINENGTWDEDESEVINIGIPEKVSEFDIDPADLPDELHAANIAFRAVTNGHGDPGATFRNRLIGYLKTSFPDLNNETVQRIATVANPNKVREAKKASIK